MAGCEKWEEAISSYLDGELSKEETAALFRHMETCPDCAGTLRLYQQLFGYEKPVAAPQGFTKSVMGAVSLVRPPRRAKKRPAVIRFLAVAAACLLVAVTAIPLFHSMGLTGSEQAAPVLRKSVVTGAGSTAGGSSNGAADYVLYSVTEDSAAPEAEEESVAEEPMAMEMMLMAAPTEAADEGAEAAEADTCSGSAYDRKSTETAVLKPVTFLVYGPTLPEELEALDFEDLGEGMSFLAEIDEVMARQLLEEGVLDYEASEDGLFHVLWYPQG